MTAPGTTRVPLTALVLAASKKGIEDPVARLQDKTHKCLVSVDGIAMIERVVQTLIDSGCFARILISIEAEHLLQDLGSTQRWLEEGKIEVVPSAGNLADSIIGASKAVDQLLPLVITTADNALHTPELLCDFVAAFEQGKGDGAVGVTHEKIVHDTYPDGDFGFFQFKDGGYSFCNLFGIRSTSGLGAATIFRTGL
jgi:GTP:adenosylcobinamide-phosphate guanylyltransferase